jgi:hypothetical protein
MTPNTFHLCDTRRMPISKLVLSSGVPEIGNKQTNEHVAWFGNPQEIRSCCLRVRLKHMYRTRKLYLDFGTQYYIVVAELLNIKGFIKANTTFIGRNSSVGIATAYGLDTKGSILGRTRDLSPLQCPDWFRGQPSLLFNGKCWLFLRG